MEQILNQNLECFVFKADEERVGSAVHIAKCHSSWNTHRRLASRRHGKGAQKSTARDCEENKQSNTDDSGKTRRLQLEFQTSRSHFPAMFLS